MIRWNKADIPHKGWKYIGIEDLGEDVYPGEEIRYEQCEMCGNEKIRYVSSRIKMKDPNAQLTQPPADRATIRLREGYDFNILGENPITKNLWIVIDNR